MANKDGTESIKLKTEVVKKVRANKKKTGIPIGTFFEQAAEEKLKKNNQLKNKLYAISNSNSWINNLGSNSYNSNGKCNRWIE